jgi:hypothetical protein
VHAARIEPYEKRLLVAVGAVDEIRRGIEEFLLDKLRLELPAQPPPKIIGSAAGSRSPT